MSAPRWAVGMQRLAPGFYSDNGAMHIDAVELCEQFGLPPTEENQTNVIQQVQRQLRAQLPGVPDEIVEKDFEER
jgi:hypothetical protein